MPDLPPLAPLPPEPTRANPGRAGEPLIIDQNTFEIKGQNSGNVYGKGKNLQEALGLQTQIQSGGTPTVAGRPDLYAVAPKPGETQAPIAGPNGGAVSPRTASPEELAARAAGTLPSFNAANAPATNNFADALRKTVEAASNEGRNKAFGMTGDGTSDQSYDNQLLTQRGLLISQLFGERVTPEELRFLSPEQQAAIRSGKKEAIEAHVIGLNSAIQARDVRRKEDAQAARDDRNATLSKLNVLKDLGLLSTLDDAALQSAADSIGLDVTALKEAVQATKDGVEWKLGDDANGNLVMYKFNPKTGTYESKIVQYKAKSGPAPADDTARIRAFQSKAADYIRELDNPTSALTWGAAWDSLRAEFPEAAPATIDSILGGRYNPDTGKYEGRAKE